MNIFDMFFNNWAILTIIIIILAIIIAFNEIRIINDKWNYQSHLTAYLKEQDNHAFYPNYFHWYSSFHNDPFQIIINIHDKFIECLEAEYQSKDTDIELGRKFGKVDNVAHFLSRISDPELKSFVQSPSKWLEQHLLGKEVHLYEKDKDPELIKIEIAELVPVFHDIIARIFNYLKLPQDKDWIAFYDLVDKRKMQYRNKRIKILSYLLSVDTIVVTLFYISVSLLTNQIAPIFIIILPMFFLGFFQPILWKVIRRKFFETPNSIFSISNKEGS